MDHPMPATNSASAGARPTPPLTQAPPTPAAQQVEIKRVMPEGPLVDIMGGAQRLECRVHTHGFIALVDVMPRLVPEGQTADAAVVQAARVSYGQGTKKVSEDRGLIRYLMRHRHTTPFEMVEVKFHVAMPIFVARQWIRHRTANVNEYSARYSIMPDRFYTPTIEEVRKQSASNRQGGEERFNTGTGDEARTAEEFLTYLKDVEAAYQRYLGLTEQGVSREMARIGLPVNIYTEWYWKCDLHNTMRFLGLRLDPHAQSEIRDYAQAMAALLEPIAPASMEAFRDYEMESVRLTRLEVDALRAELAGGTGGDSGTPSPLATDNRREQAEWEAKRARLGFPA
ncbi:MAG: FAD-dependent thymidylate synthase [Phycisphaerales bacterium]